MSRFFFYLKAILPLGLIVYFFFQDLKVEGTILLLIYSFIYRPMIDYFRLREKGVLLSFVNIYFPLVRLKYFKTLYL